MLTVEKKVKIFKALGHETRFKIFQSLFAVECVCCADNTKAEGDLIAQATCVTDIAAEFDFSLPTISRHLKEMKDANIIIMKKIKNKIYIEPNVLVARQIDVCFTDLLKNHKQFETFHESEF